MNTIYIFALVLAVAGGVIAHFGDRLGTYVGKKRISRFGLRPRHTAMLYTIFSGSAISVLTLLLLVWSNQAFRTAVSEGPRLIAENHQYQQQIKIESAKAVADQVRAQQATLELGQAQSQLEPVQQRLRAVQALLNRSQETLLRRQQQLGLAQGALKEAQTSLGGTRQDLRLARLDFLRAKQALTGEQANVQAAQKKLTQQELRNGQLKMTGQKLLAQNDTLQKNNLGLKRQSFLLGRRVAASGQTLIFRKNDELDRLVVKTAQPVNVIVNQLNSFLNDLGRIAEKRDGRLGVNGRAAVIAVPLAPNDPDYKPLNPTQEQDAVKTLAQNIAGGSPNITSVVVVARAVTNTFAGEQTNIGLQPYDNALIYPRDTLIASDVIDGSRPPLQVVEALKTFLIEKVRPAVSNQGLIPQTDLDTGKPFLGDLDDATSQALVQQIGRFGGSTQIAAYASEDTYSSGPLHLRFSVTPLAAPPAPHPADAVGRRS